MTASALSPRLLHGLDDDAEQTLRIAGTAVVIDISGFTTLSEQLAAAGREGTEQLIATLSRIFTVLLPVSDDGGDVVKFAGDALFVLFTGPDHARHAAHSAWNMNKVLTAIGDIHLPAARAKLRMSVGVHSGTFEFFLTGGDNTSVVLTGGDTSRVMALQSAADAGTILVSDETAVLLPASQVTKEESAPGARRLVKGGSVASASLMALSVGRTTAADRFLPRAFAQRPDLLASEPDHRWAAIAFVQVSGVADRPDDEDLEHMDRLTTLVETVAADTGVTLLDVDPATGGYRYFLTAGAPTTAEDPEGRLMTAALRIVRQGGGRFAVRAGVTSGRIFAGFVGAMYRQTYTVMGDPTNLAARLTARAEPGTVLVARSTLERTSRSFESTDAGTISVKGKTQQIPVAIVTGHGGATRLAAQQTPFVGRRAELDRIRELLTDAAEERGATLTLAGAAGIGKTRLLEHALAETPLAVLRGYGDPYGATTPYRTMQTVLRPLLRIAPTATPAEAGERLRDVVEGHFPDLAPWLPLIAPAVGADAADTPEVDALDAAFRAERAAETVSTFLAALTTAPGCLVVDDAQWVDPASSAVLADLISRDTRHAIVLARRPGPEGLGPLGETLEIEPLDGDSIRDILEAVAGRKLLPADARPLVARAEGNPLYAIELGSGLASGAEALAIEELIGERIDALSEADRTALRRASVLGTRIPLGLYVKCVGMPLISGGLAAFLELGAQEVSFRSELFRDVAYGQLTFQVRREVHRIAATAIEADAKLGGPSADVMLARHWEECGEWAKALEAGRRAAASAEKSFALEEAVRAYRGAVEAARRNPDSADDLPELLSALGRVSIAGGWAQEGLEAFSNARKLVTDAIERARIDRERAYALNILGRPAEAVRTLRSARRAVSGSGHAGRAVLAAIAVTESGLRLRQGKWAEAKRLALDAIELIEDVAETDTEKGVLADAMRYHDIAASELAGDEGMLYLQRALDLYDATGDELSKSKIMNLIGARSYYRGEWTLAATLYAQAEAAAEAAGDVVGAAIESANVAEVLVDQGRVDEARPLLRDMMRVFEASDNPYLIAIATTFTARGHLRSGERDAAREAFATAADLFASLEDNDWSRENRVRLAETEIDDGEFEAARAIVEAIDPAEAGPVRSRLLRQSARLAALDGDLPRARELGESAIDAAAAVPFEKALSMALLARLAGADDPDADALRTDARSILTDLGLVDVDDVLAAGDTGAALPVESAKVTR
ncbi:adenylate/guanylate cyclase domain-containing protein [Microbacterium sp. NPDC019599]|uniref:adenylate/guanylate cyclase domain-containing protein n=1 Tax=Microbacterium sp. NPDC019599 TaxID=3154690 RepID=UPI00340B4FDF